MLLDPDRIRFCYLLKYQFQRPKSASLVPIRDLRPRLGFCRSRHLFRCLQFSANSVTSGEMRNVQSTTAISHSLGSRPLTIPIVSVQHDEADTFLSSDQSNEPHRKVGIDCNGCPQ